MPRAGMWKGRASYSWNENWQYGPFFRAHCTSMGGGISTYGQNRMKERSFFYPFQTKTKNWYFWPKSLKWPVSRKLWSTQWALLFGMYTYGTHALGATAVKKWAGHFWAGRESTSDNAQGGRPRMAHYTAKVEHKTTRWGRSAMVTQRYR